MEEYSLTWTMAVNRIICGLALYIKETDDTTCKWIYDFENKRVMYCYMDDRPSRSQQTYGSCNEHEYFITDDPEVYG